MHKEIVGFLVIILIKINIHSVIFFLFFILFSFKRINKTRINIKISGYRGSLNNSVWLWSVTMEYKSFSWESFYISLSRRTIDVWINKKINAEVNDKHRFNYELYHITQFFIVIICSHQQINNQIHYYLVLLFNFLFWTLKITISFVFFNLL